MGFTDETVAMVQGDASAEAAVLIAAARGADLAGMEAEAERLFQLARLNKMLGALPLTPAALPRGCADLAPRLLQVHLQTLGMNRRALAVTAEVTAALGAAGLRHVVLKGPLQQVAVDGQPFRRPSGDIDLFVAPRDRAAAARVLKAAGFTALEEEMAGWWIGFLGEQHFTRAADGAVVDLHHRLQQAGLPGWRGSRRVLDRAGRAGLLDVPVPAPADGCLLMAVTIAKALLGHEPCGWAAVELGRWLRVLDAAQRADLAAAARDSGQAQTLALGVAMASACGDSRLAADLDLPRDALRGLPADEAVRRDLAFQPWRRRAEAPRRRQMLRMLAAGRPHVLAVEGVRAALSPLVRDHVGRVAGD